MDTRTCDMLIKITPKNKGSVLMAVNLLQKAHAIDEYDARDILESIETMEQLQALDEIQMELEAIYQKGAK